MSDKANCKNCIHFDEIKRRCCLNDDSWVQKECYFRRNNRKPMGNDVIFEKQGEIIKDLQSQLDQQKAMWNELKEHISNQIIHYDELSDKFKEENNNGCVLLANSKRSMIEEILYKMQELEQGEKE